MRFGPRVCFGGVKQVREGETESCCGHGQAYRGYISGCTEAREYTSCPIISIQHTRHSTFEVRLLYIGLIFIDQLFSKSQHCILSSLPRSSMLIPSSLLDSAGKSPVQTSQTAISNILLCYHFVSSTFEDFSLQLLSFC